MQITDLLGQMGGIHSVAKELGVDEQQATRGAAALIPALLGGFKKQVTSQPAGVAGLGTMLGRLGGGNLLDEVLSPQPTDLNHGNAVLGQIFGSKEVSRAVAQNAAATSGLDPSLLKKMLPMLAMLVAGFMAKQPAGDTTAQLSAPGGGLGKLLGGLLGGRRSGSNTSAGLASLLDLDGDGNPLDDILQLVGKRTR